MLSVDFIHSFSARFPAINQKTFSFILLNPSKAIIVNTFLLNAETEFNAFKNTKEKYKKKVNQLSNAFGLTTPYNLRNTELPTFWSGNLKCRKEKIALVEINPQYDKQLMTFENNFRSRDWENYAEFHNSSFLQFKNKSEAPVKYYHEMANALAGKSFKDNSYFDFLQKTVLRFELIPYASANFNASILETEADEYLFNRFTNDLLPFISQRPNVKKAMIHNKRMCKVLLEKDFISADHMIYVRMNKGRNHDFIYRKKLKGLELFIFSRQIQYGGFSKGEVYSNVF